ncbi:MAG TPA: hypothetical protein VNJ07_03025 [Chitinophagales bacterium]|nr:hypothetical protein [Chitinophagales bacterium]
MELRDWYFAPLFFLVIYIVAIIARNRLYPEGHPLRRYFMPALSVKLMGAFIAGVIYYYYYRDGDTIYYFDRVKLTYMVYESDFVKFWRLMFVNAKSPPPDLYYNLLTVRGFDTSQYMVVRIASILAIPVFRIYTGIALLFAALSFTGVWAMFVTFCKINPKLVKEFAISCLFIPSVFFWGSGLFKDTIAIGFVGWFAYAVHMLFIQREKIFRNSIILIISFYVLYVIKTYIIMAFVPAIVIWVFFKYRDNIKNDFIRTTVTPILIVVSLAGAFFVLTQISGEGGYWSIDQMSARAKDMQWWHLEVKNIYGSQGGGSYYSLGSGDFTLGNLIRTFPLAVNVALFRPYLWEAHNPVMFISAIESLFFFIFTLRIIFKVGLPMSFRIAVANPEVFFALLFSIIFAFAVGFTSFNFGALVRYKIPAIPFYVMALYLIRHHANILKNKGALAPAEK